MIIQQYGFVVLHVHVSSPLLLVNGVRTKLLISFSLSGAFFAVACKHNQVPILQHVTCLTGCKYRSVSGHCNLTSYDIYIHDVYRIVSDHCNHICTYTAVLAANVMTHVPSLECQWSLQTMAHLPWSWWPSGGPSASWYTSVPLPRYKPTAHRITSGWTIRLSHTV